MQPEPEYPHVDFAMGELPDLHDILADLRERHAVAPVVYHGGVAYLITRFADVQHAFSDDDAFPSAAAYARHSLPSMGKTIQCMGGDEHRRNRGLVSKAFRPRLMTEFVESFLTPVAHELIDGIAAAGEADLVRDFTTRYAFTVITRLLDFPPTDFEQLKSWGDSLIDFPWDPEGALRAREEFTAYLTPVIEERRKRPSEDLASALTHAAIDNDGAPQALPSYELLSYFFLLVVAGNETTRNATTGGLLALIENPGELERVRADPGLLDPMVEEVLRWTSPVVHFCRTASEDVELHGQKIRAGDTLCLFYPSANRDERSFERADAFEVDRWPNRHIAFGIGEHFCLGAHVARLELRSLFRQLIARLEFVELAGEVERLRSSVIGGIKHMPIRYRLAAASGVSRTANRSATKSR